MALSNRTLAGMRQSSWIRQMFEAGDKLKKKLGPDNVFDLSLGNPVTEPPALVAEALLKLAEKPLPGMHRYMPNAGYTHTRNAVAGALSRELGMAFGGEDIVMTCGAAGAINVALKAILEPGEEVVLLCPYFPEYISYVENHGGAVRKIPAGKHFVPEPDCLENSIGAGTRVVIINSPNNPTGIMYDDSFLAVLSKALIRKSREYGRPIYLISDEPYRRILYDGIDYASPVKHYANSIIASSFSKDLALPGERIGYLAVNPVMEGKTEMLNGFIYCNRILGFVNAPAMMQHLVSNLLQVSVSIDGYQRKRDFLYHGLQSLGFNVIKPAGAFYMFPQIGDGDDIGFVGKLMDYGVLAVPGSGFGAPGYIRLSYCVEDEVLEGALRGIKKAVG
ncbi:MAG: pyridoxal phosphate-dependent aminotransferase [Dehalococcoidaceae bacterium]|nr:pyridoxal phosphate-dependent aminotransferase [Dehalococcoidaceae bacterium]